jgi:hypothetical protein
MVEAGPTVHEQERGSVSDNFNEEGHPANRHGWHGLILDLLLYT